MVPAKINTADEDIIRQFGSKLDTHYWPEGRNAIAKFLLATVGEKTIARVSDASSARPWLEASYQTANADGRPGKLMVCGFGIVKYWKSTPVPRYLLRGMLESCSNPAVFMDRN